MADIIITVITVSTTLSSIWNILDMRKKKRRKRKRISSKAFKWKRMRTVRSYVRLGMLLRWYHQGWIIEVCIQRQIRNMWMSIAETALWDRDAQKQGKAGHWTEAGIWKNIIKRCARISKARKERKLWCREASRQKVCLRIWNRTMDIHYEYHCKHTKKEL